MAEKQQKTTPQDFFLNLLAVVSLYISATAFTTLLFQYINALFPDPLQLSPTSFGAIRFAIASLVVLFPTYVSTVWFLQKQYQREPARKEVAVRRWAVHFTLFVAAMIIIGDIVALITRFLGGELTVRFLLKVVALLFTAGIVFGYYLWDLRSERRREPQKQLVVGVSALVLVLVVAGIFIIGSPQKERLRRLDDRRVSDLQFLQSEIVAFWQAKGRLPAELNELRDDIRGVVPPVDPVTGEPYEYRALGNVSFELCATFATGSEQGSVAKRLATPYRSVNWDHDAGRSCFTRDIDPDLFNRKEAQPAADIL